MPDEKDREEAEQENELAVQQDLNQGMDTGTHDSEKLGVDWPASYRRKLHVAKDTSTKPNPRTTTTTATRRDGDDTD